MPDALYQLPVKSGEAVSDGAIVFENALAVPFVLESVQPLYQSGHTPDNVTVLGTKVIALDRSRPSDNGRGIQRTYPPELGAGETAFAVEGHRIPAGQPATERYALVVGLRVDGGMGVIVGLKVNFRVDGIEYSQLINHELLLCADQPKGATHCPAPPPA